MSGVEEVCARLRPGYPELARHLIEALAAEARVQCVLVTGSLATGLADRYRDLDLSVVVNNADAHRRALGRLARSHRRSGVFGHADPRAGTGVHRRDRGLAARRRPARAACGRHPPTAPAAPGGFRPRPLRERTTRRRQAPPPAPRPLVEEFLRVLGLLDVVMGRGEYFVGTQGFMLLRQYLVELFHAENGQPHTGGAKRVTHTLTAEQAALLATQPPLNGDREAVIAGHLAAAHVFLPRARRLLDQQHLPWPTTFAAATRRHLQRTLNLDMHQLTEP